MMENNIKIGDIIKMDKRVLNTIGLPNELFLYSFQVLAVDDVEVFLNVLNDKGSGDIFDTKHLIKGMVYYARESVKAIRNFGKIISNKQVDMNLLTLIQPNLPFRMCRSMDLEWDSKILSNRKSIRDFISTIRIRSVDNNFTNLNLSQVYIEPYGKNGRQVKLHLVSADNNQYFTWEELLWKAYQIQNGVLVNYSNGIGLYRSGHYNSIPIYYVGGYIDRAEFLQ